MECNANRQSLQEKEPHVYNRTEQNFIQDLYNLYNSVMLWKELIGYRQLSHVQCGGLDFRHPNLMKKQQQLLHRKVTRIR